MVFCYMKPTKEHPLGGPSRLFVVGLFGCFAKEVVKKATVDCLDRFRFALKDFVTPVFSFVGSFRFGGTVFFGISLLLDFVATLGKCSDAGLEKFQPIGLAWSGLQWSSYLLRYANMFPFWQNTWLPEGL